VRLPDGRPARDTWLDVRYYGKVRTDGRGRVRLDAPPPGPIRFETVDGSLRAEVDIVRGRIAGPVVLRVK
jgi:hypothetical protein